MISKVVFVAASLAVAIGEPQHGFQGNQGNHGHAYSSQSITLLSAPAHQEPRVIEYRQPYTIHPEPTIRHEPIVREEPVYQQETVFRQEPIVRHEPFVFQSQPAHEQVSYQPQQVSYQPQSVLLHQQAVPVVEAHQPEHAVVSGPTDYAFQYQIEDPHTGDNKYHHETRDGETVKGVYSLRDSDGTVRIVEYTADKHNGFNAVVKQAGKVTHPAPAPVPLH